MTSSSHLICAMSLGNKATKSIKQVNGRDRFFIFLTLIVIGITYAYYDLKNTGETVSSVQIGGATISANFVLTMII